MALGRPDLPSLPTLMIEKAIELGLSGIVSYKQGNEDAAEEYFEPALKTLLQAKNLLTVSQYATLLSFLPPAIEIEEDKDNLVDRVVSFLQQDKPWEDNETYDSLRNYAKACAAIVKNYQRRRAAPQDILSWLEAAIEPGRKALACTLNADEDLYFVATLLFEKADHLRTHDRDYAEINKLLEEATLNLSKCKKVKSEYTILMGNISELWSRNKEFYTLHLKQMNTYLKQMHTILETKEQPVAMETTVDQKKPLLFHPGQRPSLERINAGLRVENRRLKIQLCRYGHGMFPEPRLQRVAHRKTVDQNHSATPRLRKGGPS